MTNLILVGLRHFQASERMGIGMPEALFGIYRESLFSILNVYLLF